MQKRKVKVGMAVTCKTSVPAYDEGFMFHPGMIGIVNATNRPSTVRERVSFCCIDFTTSDGKTRRCALLYDNIAQPTRSKEQNRIHRLLELKSLAYSRYIGEDSAYGRWELFPARFKDLQVEKFKKIRTWVLRELHRIGYDKTTEIRRQRIERLLDMVGQEVPSE